MDETVNLLRRELTRRQILRAAAKGGIAAASLPGLMAILEACANGSQPSAGASAGPCPG